MFSLWVLLFMVLFTVVLAHRYEWFNTRVSNTSCSPLIRIAKKKLCICSCRKVATMVNRRGLLLLLLLGGDMSLNPGPLTLGVFNARSIRNKGPLLADMVVTFWKNSCHLLVSCHLLILHIISVVTSTFMLIFQMVMVINV